MARYPKPHLAVPTIRRDPAPGAPGAARALTAPDQRSRDSHTLADLVRFVESKAALHAPVKELNIVSGSPEAA
jgi:hypothetical protein